MKIYKIAQVDKHSEKYYWILPNGKIKEVPLEGHTEYLLNHPEEFNVSKKEQNDFKNAFQNNIGEFSLYNFAFEHGAICFSFIYGKIFIRGRAVDVRKNIEIIYNIAKNSIYPIEFTDELEKTITVSKEDLYKI